MRSPILCITDPHFHSFKAFSTVMPSGMDSRLWHAIKAWEEAVRIGIDQGCRTVACSGDIFHVRGHLRPSTYNAVYDAIQETSDRGMKIVMIPGNHDLENYYDHDTSIDKLQGIKGVTVLRGDTAYHTADGWEIVGIPYFHNPEKFKAKYADICGQTNPDIVLTHEHFDEYTPVVMGKRGIDFGFLHSHIKDSAFVVNGHQHFPEYIPGSRVLNVGSPLPQTFGDTGEAYGCWILHDGKEPEFHPLSAPKFLTVEGFRKGDEAKVRGNYVRVQAKTDKTAISVREKCMAAGALGVVAAVVKDFAAAPGKTIKVSTKEKMLAEYIDIMGGEYAAKKAQIIDLYQTICS